MASKPRTMRHFPCHGNTCGKGREVKGQTREQEKKEETKASGRTVKEKESANQARPRSGLRRLARVAAASVPSPHSGGGVDGSEAIRGVHGRARRGGGREGGSGWAALGRCTKQR